MCASVKFEGTVLSVGICSTYIRTIKNEEVHIANNVPHQRCDEKFFPTWPTRKDFFLPAKVTSISYRTPWRQVEAMLKEAARRTPGLLAQT